MSLEKKYGDIMYKLIAIAFGGSFGAVSRYYLSKIISDYSGAVFPWGTLSVNLAGSVLIGFFYGLSDKVILPLELKTCITVGFLGAFTTFSTLALESINLLRDGEIKLGIINICLNNFFGLLSVLIGFYIAGIIIQK